VREGWQTKRLVDVCEVFADGDWIETKDQSPQGIRLVQTGNIGEGAFKSRGEKARYVSAETFRRLRCTEIFDGDCLISRLPEPVGRACLLPDIGERMITGVDCTIVRFNREQLSPRFFNYFSQSGVYLGAVESEATGTTRKRISRTKLGQVLVPVPPIPEQQRIISVLDELFDTIAAAKANAERNLQNARAVFESRLDDVFVRHVFGWAETTLGETYDVRDGTHDSPRYQTAGFPLITSKNLKREGLSFDEVSLIGDEDYAKINQRSAVHKGDVLFAMIGTIGNPTLVEVEPAFAIKNVALFKIPSGQSGAFLRYYLSYGGVVSRMMEEAKGTTQKFVGLGYLRRFPVRLPPISDQMRIVEELDRLSAQTQRLESIYQRKLAALDALKQSLLHQAFTGQLGFEAA
jgi:type I restriction enzyme S subunit